MTPRSVAAWLMAHASSRSRLLSLDRPPCSNQTPATKPAARNVLLITIDTLRADHVGAYGYTRGANATLDALAKNGVLFERAYAAAPITLPSHATLLTGRYPPGHGARDNGLHVTAGVPTLATALHAKGFATAAFVAAFPLDHQFGLNRGFDVYGDRLPRGADGRLANERPAADVVNDAIHMAQSICNQQSNQSAVLPVGPSVRTPRPLRRSLVRPIDGRSLRRRDRDGRSRSRPPDCGARTGGSDDADCRRRRSRRSVRRARRVRAQHLRLRHDAARAADDERPGHSGRHCASPTPVTLADVAPTVMRALGAPMTDVDGIDLSPALASGALAAARASSTPSRSRRWSSSAGRRCARCGPDGWKLIAAPKPELFNVETDPGEQATRSPRKPEVAQRLDSRVARYSSDALNTNAAVGGDAAQRLRALGYASGSRSAIPSPQSAMSRPDPKDRRELAGADRAGHVGRTVGRALVSALEGIVRADAAQRPGAPAPRLRAHRGRRLHARRAGIHARRSTAGCRARTRTSAWRPASGGATTWPARSACCGEAQRREPDNPVIAANLGLVFASRKRLAGGDSRAVRRARKGSVAARSALQPRAGLREGRTPRRSRINRARPARPTAGERPTAIRG